MGQGVPGGGSAPGGGHPLLVDTPGHAALLLGNEAIVRGALEAGIGFASGYPGTPSSEVTDELARLSPLRGFHFEYSVNEKIAVEMAFAASLAGARSICAMKHLGLMSAGDPISTIPYIGVEAGMVIVSAGDPSCRTSPNEQDQRRLGPMLHIPVLDPSTPQEALEMTRFAFELSEASRLPVLLRPTTRVCHSRTSVAMGSLRTPSTAGFRPNPSRYVPIPINARRMRQEIKGRLATARRMVTEEGLFRRGRPARRVILAAGAPAATCADVLDGLSDHLDVALWTLGGLYPLPEDAIAAALQGVEQVLVVEELSPYLEEALLVLCARRKLPVEVLGKLSGHFPEEFEYTPDVIGAGLSLAFGEVVAKQPATATAIATATATTTAALTATPRPPTLCPGCPHRAAYVAARAAFDDEQLFFNDIGCYTLGYGPPLDTADALLCMGAGFTLASGVAKVTGQRTVGFMGDSTFFHSGMPALLDAIKERANLAAVILDNRVTAMTGFQESPAAKSEHEASIEAVVRALEPASLEVVDPYDQPATIAAFKRARHTSGVSVVIVQRVCPVHDARSSGRPFSEQSLVVQDARCRSCGRDHLGLRCDQPLTEGWQRVMARARAAWPVEVRPEQAPCSERCPLSLCIQGYIGHIAAGEYEEALGYIVDRVVLPEAVCRVCDRPCEASCVRRDSDGALAINDLKRFVIQWARTAAPGLLVHHKAPSTGQRVAVVGAGPAGLAAAAELAMRGHAVDLYDAADRPGGLLARGIPAFRLPPAALERDIARVLQLGVSFHGGRALGADLHTAALFDEGVAAICLAIGAHQPRVLQLEGAGEVDAPALVSALEWLKAQSDADGRAGARVQVRDQRVLVIGGGNAAMDAGRCALRLGATSVAIACLEPRDEMPALAEEIVAAEDEGVAMHVAVKPVRLTAAGVRFEPLLEEVDGLTLAADVVLVAIGQRPDRDALIGELAAPDIDQNGCLLVEPGTCVSPDPRIFAAGDLVPGERTVTAAIASGRRAAWAIDRRLRGDQLANERPPPAPTARPAPLPSPALPRKPRQSAPHRPLQARRSGFGEVVGVMDEAAARAEAERCLLCGRCGLCRSCIDLLGCPGFELAADGRIAIETTLCTGCGVCAEVCPNDAIEPGALGAAS